MFVLTGVLWCVAAALAVALVAARYARRAASRKEAAEGLEVVTRAPGPRAWPVIGSMHLLGQHSNPFLAFTALSKVYGGIYSMVLGAVPCVVVNNYDLIKEVLITKGSHFGGRPDFLRYHKLFGGNRNNCEYCAVPRTWGGFVSWGTNSRWEELGRKVVVD